MERIVLGDPAWSDTFPHRMAPHPEEAFVSLLLRCDEENGWASGRTYAHVRNLLYYPAHLPDLVVPSQRSVDTLAMRLCLPIGTIAATTYLWELMRLFETVTPSSRDLCESFVFRLCPICIKEHRVILRYHFLLGMTTCLQHRISLLSSCTCGAVLRPFAPRSSPFTCRVCVKDWSGLPHVPAAPKDLEEEQLILACYEWWLKYGSQASLLNLPFRLENLNDYVSRKSRGPSRWSRWTRRKRYTKRWSRLRSSRGGPLSMMVWRLDRLDLLDHFSGET